MSSNTHGNAFSTFIKKNSQNYRMEAALTKSDFTTQVFSEYHCYFYYFIRTYDEICACINSNLVYTLLRGTYEYLKRCGYIVVY